jgi:bacillithiol system protein YtxJ
MNWNQLDTINQLGSIDLESQTQPIMILKHSTTCSISAMALNRLERKWSHGVPIKPYYLDLLSHRDISNEIASRYGVQHESPQVLIIKGGQCVFNASHSEIIYDEIITNAS